MQYHACSGTGRPMPAQTGEITDLQALSGSGVISDFMMYADFMKLLKRDTLAKFRERFLDAMVDLEQSTPPESGDPNFGLDTIMDVFDNVSNGFRDDSSV